MGQLLHARATTTQRQREVIQHSEESIAKLAKRFGVNPKTIIKWRRRDYVHDDKMGAGTPRSALTLQEQDLIAAFRRKTRLPLDDCYIALKDAIPALTRSNLHRCLKRQGLSVLPKEATPKATTRFKDYALGYFHLDICEVRTGEAKAYLYVAVDRTCKFVYVEIHPSPTTSVAVEFLRHLTQAVPYNIHTILTDNGVQFTYALLLPHCQPKAKDGSLRPHRFDALCQQLGIKHRLTKFRHPWTNGQVERMNRTLKEATVKIYHYDTLAQLKKHVYDFLMAFNYAKKLKSLQFKTPYEKILDTWKLQPGLFHTNPSHYKVGLNS
jgi:transposase InsO family protein